MNSLKIGVIGCGKQGEKHLNTLQKVSGFQACCADLDMRLAEKISSQFSAEVLSVDDMLNDISVAGVIICTPVTTHFSLIERALISGKNVLVEKPLVADVMEASRIAELERETGCFVLVGYIYRYAEAFEYLHDLNNVKDGNGESSLGKPVHAIFRIGGRGEHQEWKHQRTCGGGAVNEMFVHMLDLAQWILGPLDSVKVTSRDLLLPQRSIGGQVVDVSAEDYVVVQCETMSSAPVLIVADMLTPAFTQYADIQFENGSYWGSIQTTFQTSVFLKEGRGELEKGQTVLNVMNPDLYRKQLEYFGDCIKKICIPNKNTTCDSLEILHFLRKM